MKNMAPSDSPADYKIRIMPDPNIPAKPVPLPKQPTTVEGKPLQNPRVVLSPKALTVPSITEANKEMKKEASTVLKVQANEMMIKPIAMLTELTSIRVK